MNERASVYDIKQEYTIINISYMCPITIASKEKEIQKGLPI